MSPEFTVVHCSNKCHTYPSPHPPLRQFFDVGIAGKPQTSKMIKATHPHPGESVDTTSKDLLLAVSHLGTHLGDATTIEKFKVCKIKEIDKMIVDGPASDFHKVKLEGSRAGGGIFNAIFATVLRFLVPPSIPSLYCSLPPEPFRLFFAFSTPFSISSLTSTS